ncbi:hypothetical protein FBY23_3074 [Nocardioides sp. SLBN-35]|nr:hypothetical protein FBY23_3074 [Nocardioides sp. SLBN-35]
MSVWFRADAASLSAGSIHRNGPGTARPRAEYAA